MIRAFCGALDLPWDIVYSALCKIGAEHHNLPNASEVYDCFAKKMGFIRISGQRMNVSEFAASHGGVYFILIKGHAVCVKNHQIFDCSDCGWGRIESCYVKADSMTDDDKPARTRQTRVYTPSAIELEILEELEKESDNTLEGEKASPAFTYYNPNPEACSEKKSGTLQNVVKIDNVIRAFSGFLNLSWDEVYSELCRLGMAQHDMPDSKSVITRYAKEKGLIKKTLRAAVSLSSFAKSHDGDYLVQLRMGLSPEMTYVTERKIHDIYNPGSRKVRTYYVKAL